MFRHREQEGLDTISATDLDSLSPLKWCGIKCIILMVLVVVIQDVS